MNYWISLPDAIREEEMRNLKEQTRGKHCFDIKNDGKVTPFNVLTPLKYQ